MAAGACRELAEDAVKHFEGLLPLSAPWTAGATLPGGEIGLDFDAALTRLIAVNSEVPAYRWLRNYGSFAFAMAEAPGEHLGEGVYAAEIEHLRDGEFATQLSDVLWRRTKLGLKTSAETQAAIEARL